MAEYELKTCTICGESKALTAFYKRKDSPDGYRKNCKECKAKVDRKWCVENPEKVNAHKGAWVERNLDKRREQASAWQSRNLDKARIYVNNRRALIEGISLPGDTWERMIAHYGEECAQCGVNENLTLDHVIPLSKGGSHTISNLQILCAKHNSAKGNRNSNDYRRGAILNG